MGMSSQDLRAWVEITYLKPSIITEDKPNLAFIIQIHSNRKGNSKLWLTKVL